MVWIAPFRGVLYNQTRIADLSKVVAPPYDVITPEEQDALYRKSPHNIVRLILNRDPDSYETAGQLLKTWQKEGYFVRDEKPAVYFVAQSFKLKSGEEKERRGFFALARLEDFSTGSIYPHEKTLDKPKQDRLQILVSCQANLSSIFAIYSEPKNVINRLLVESVQGVPPRVKVSDGGGGRCLMWSVTDPALLQKVQETMQGQALLIADGHHRYEASLNYRNYIRQQRKNWTGREAFNYVLMYFANMKDDGLIILPTHRLVRGYQVVPFPKLEKALQNYFYVEPYPKTKEGRNWFLRALRSGSSKKHVIGASFSGDPRYLILRLKNKRTMQRLAPEMSPALRELDVNILHLLILQNLLGLSPEMQATGDHIRYLEEEQEALKLVEAERDQAAFILNPPKPEAVLEVALRHEKLPQKSTYFFPKLLSGLVLNKIDMDENVQDGSGE